MTAAQAKTALKIYGFDDNDPLLSWLDEAKIEVEDSFDWPFLKGIATVAVAQGTSAVNLILPDAKIKSIRDTTNKNRLEEWDIVRFEREIVDTTQTGKPQLYTFFDETQPTAPPLGPQIQLYPVPDAAISLRVVYHQVLGDINGWADPTVLPGPTRLHYLYVIGAASIGLQADNEEDRATSARAMFDAGISRTIRRYSKPIGEGRTVRDVMGYGN